MSPKDRKAYQKEYQKLNKERLNAYNRGRHAQKRDEINASRRDGGKDKRYRERNLEDLQLRDRYRAQETGADRLKEYREENNEHVKEVTAEYRERNREKLREYKREWSRKNKNNKTSTALNYRKKNLYTLRAKDDLRKSGLSKLRRSTPVGYQEVVKVMAVIKKAESLINNEEGV